MGGGHPASGRTRWLKWVGEGSRIFGHLPYSMNIKYGGFIEYTINRTYSLVTEYGKFIE